MSENGDQTTAADFLPDSRTLAAVRRAAAGCRGCHLWQVGTQTVFGEGLRRSRLMLVGEMPGNDEDRSGKPFVGPAGRILNDALDEAAIERSNAYVTNVVKHFKWEPRGRRRLHRTPNAREIRACLPWLEAEIDLVRPEVIACLGATAARVLIGRDFRVSRQHGEFVESELAPHLTATVHPSSILRRPTREERHAEMSLLIEDMRRIAKVMNGQGNGG